MVLPMLKGIPSWWHISYPTREDLEKWANDTGCEVGDCNDLPGEAVFFPSDIPESGGKSVILLPTRCSHLRIMYLLAHELGHLFMHTGTASQFNVRRDEFRADWFASMVLIPERRIKIYNNASVDAFIAALSANYSEIPAINCKDRWLAAKIARCRLDVMKWSPEIDRVRSKAEMAKSRKNGSKVGETCA